MMKTNHRWLTGAVALAVMLAGGCAGKSPPVTFYALGIDAPVAPARSAGTACSDKGIAVGPINWPRYLDQPRIVTRSGPNTMDFNEFRRWGGSLEDDFGRVLVKYLSGLLLSSKVANFRITQHFKPDYKLELDVRQFDGQLGGAVVLDVAWILIARKTGKVLGMHDSVITKQMSGEDYEALVRASSLAVAELSGEIAAELLKLCSAAK